MSVIDDLKDYEPFYSSFETEVVDFLNEIKNKHKSTLDIHLVYGRIKLVESIDKKIRESNGKYEKMRDLQDILGIRVVCHCFSDLERLDTILSEEFKKNFLDVERYPRSGEDGYRGIHYIIKKDFEVGDKRERLPCEIQLRTVLQDAWAVQSHQYGYKKKVEGDADILKQVVSGILDNCENLWELVKKSIKSGENIGIEEVSTIYQDTTKKVGVVDNNSVFDNIEKFISSNKLVEIEDVLEREYQNVKSIWEKGYSEASIPERAIIILEEMENELNVLTAIGVLAIKHNKITILRKILDKFGYIISLADGKGGYTNVLSVPTASIHNAFYYFGIYAVIKLNSEAIHLLLNYKIERDHNGELYYFRIWESGSIFAPEVIHGADKMFDHLKDNFVNNNFIKKFIIVTDEEFIDFACQFNMLFCLKAVKDQEIDGKELWAFPNFGRFYLYRVSKFIDRIKNREDYQKFIEGVMEEKRDIFISKLKSRIQSLASRGLGSGYFWQSIRE